MEYKVQYRPSHVYPPFRCQPVLSLSTRVFTFAQKRQDEDILSPPLSKQQVHLCAETPDSDSFSI